MNFSKFPENFRRCLNNNEMTEKQIAEFLGTTQATVSRWLLGVNQPDMDTLIQICLYLDETPDSILGFDDIPVEVVNEYYEKTKATVKQRKNK